MSGNNPGRSLGHGIQRRSVAAYLVRVENVNWATFTCDVVFKDSPGRNLGDAKGLMAHGHIWTPSGSGGTLYLPLKNGDVALAIVTGHDLGELIRNRGQVKQPTNPALFDKSCVLVLPAVFCDNGEPAARKTSSPPAAGEWVLHHESGSQVRLLANGDIKLIPASGRSVVVGDGATLKAVAVNGDSVAGGAVQASQSALKVGV